MFHSNKSVVEDPTKGNAIARKVWPLIEKLIIMKKQYNIICFSGDFNVDFE